MALVVIIPIYRSQLEPFEKISFLRLKQLIAKDVYLVAPEGLCINEYKSLWPDVNVEYFDADFFKSVVTYNKLMLSTELYKLFSAYEWMLVYQLDAFLFHTNFEPFINSKYDYFGAPWTPGQLVHPVFINPYLLKIFGTRVSVGNGGLSLRRISSTIELLNSKRNQTENWLHNEDGFFAYWGVKSRKYKCCTFKMASLFSFEKDAEKLFKINGEILPLGCHGLPRYNQKFYSSIILPLLNTIEGVDSILIEEYESLACNEYRLDNN